MNAPDKVLAQRGMHRSVTGNTGLSGKCLGPNADVKVALAAFLITRVAAMAFAVIHNVQLARRNARADGCGSCR